VNSNNLYNHLNEYNGVCENVCILGATGSIGLNTLDVISQHPKRYNAFALTAYDKHEDMFQLCQRYQPEYAVMVDSAAAEILQQKIDKLGLDIKVLSGEKALEVVASHESVEIVMAAIVGAAGLRANLAAAAEGKKVLLANKESLVMSGQLFMAQVQDASATLLPIDSEHNAIFQCLPQSYRCGNKLSSDIRRILLTASGGPFREYSYERLSKVTPKQACKHPNWSMGQKISVDSASLMNKGLELIEACWLFNLQPEQIDVHVHPESIVHSMVEYIDGSIISQMGNPDMRTPIAYGMAWPERIVSGVKPLDLFDIAKLTFERPNHDNFPCLQIARDAFKVGGTACAVMNAANEVAVAAFLKGNIAFTSIPDIISSVLENSSISPVESINQVVSADLGARLLTEDQILARYQSKKQLS